MATLLPWAWMLCLRFLTFTHVCAVYSIQQAWEVVAEDGHFDVANYLRGLVGLPPVDPAEYASDEEDDDDEGNDSDDDGMDEQQPAE